MTLVCEICGKERMTGRKQCRQCYLEIARKRAKTRKRYTYTLICKACQNQFIAWRKTSILCPECYNSRNSYKLTLSTNNYEYSSNYKEHIWQHRIIAEQTLRRPLKSNEVVHHMDENPKNNAITNLIVISRALHIRLHSYLSQQRVIIEKSMNENSENCWNNFIVPMTTTWLETANVKVIKLWEISQPAAEPLKEDTSSTEEGSETMHGDS